MDPFRLSGLGAVLVRRRSGGGAVWVDNDLLWIDVEIPTGDPLWEHDIAKAFLWLGESMAELLRAYGLSVSVHPGKPLVRTLSSKLCFAGVGAGEVLYSDGRKLAGISQRRTRDGARFQVGLLRRWAPDLWAPVLGLGDDELAELGGVAVGLEDLGVRLDVPTVLGAITAR